MTEVASILCISRPTMYKLMREYNISTAKFAQCKDEQLDFATAYIKAEHTHVGEVMLNGHVRSRGMVVQRKQLRESIRMVDSTGVEFRRRTTIT